MLEVELSEVNFISIVFPSFSGIFGSAIPEILKLVELFIFIVSFSLGFFYQTLTPLIRFQINLHNYNLFSNSKIFFLQEVKLFFYL